MGKLNFYAALCNKLSKSATQLAIPFLCFADHSKVPFLYNQEMLDAVGPISVKSGLTLSFEDESPNWFRTRDSLEITFFDSRPAVLNTIGGDAKLVRDASALKLSSPGGALLLCFLDSDTDKAYLLSCFCFALTELLYQQRMEGEQSLASASFRLQEIFDLLPVAAYFKDISGQYVFANAHRADQMGVSIKELISSSDYQFMQIADAVNQAAEEARVMEAGTPLFLVKLFRDKSGNSCWMTAAKAPVYDANGKVAGVCGMALEMPDSPAGSQFLLHMIGRNALTGRIAASMPVLVYTLELSQGMPIVFLDGSPDILQRIDISPTHWTDLVHPDDRYRVWTRLKRCCVGEAAQTLYLQYRMLTRTGGFLYVMSVITVVYGPHGVFYAQGVLADTTIATSEIVREPMPSHLSLQGADPLPQAVRAYLQESDLKVEITDDRLRNENMLLKRDLIKHMAISDLLSRVIQASDSGKGVRQVMEIIGSSLALGRVFIFETDKNGEYLWLAHEWIESGISTLSMHIPKVDLAAARKEVTPGMPILMLNDLQAAQRYKLAKKFAECGEKSFILKGFYEDGQLTALVGISDSRVERVWENEVDLETLADVLSLVASLNARVRSASEAQNTLECFARVIDNVSSCILVCDYDTRKIIYTNNRFINELTSGRSIVGKLCSEAFRGMPSAPAGCTQSAETVHMSPHSRIILKDYYHEATGRWYSQTHSGLYWVDGRLALMMCLVDITDNKHKDKKIWDMAYRDNIVGLANRAKLLMDFDDEYVYKDGMLALINLDNFSGINLAFGYNYGNRLLMTVANYLRQACGEKHVPYRLGKDEFAVVVFHYPDFDMYEFISNLHLRFNEMWQVGEDESYYCGASIGVVRFPEYGSNAAAALRNADSALHKAKADGKGNIAFYQPSYSDATNSVIHLSNHLRAALLDCSELQVYY